VVDAAETTSSLRVVSFALVVLIIQGCVDAPVPPARSAWEWEGVRRPGNATKILFFFRGGEGDHDDDDDDDCVWIGGHARRAEMDAFG